MIDITNMLEITSIMLGNLLCIILKLLVYEQFFGAYSLVILKIMIAVLKTLTPESHIISC